MRARRKEMGDDGVKDDDELECYELERKDVVAVVSRIHPSMYCSVALAPSSKPTRASLCHRGVAWSASCQLPGAMGPDGLTQTTLWC